MWSSLLRVRLPQRACAGVCVMHARMPMAVPMRLALHPRALQTSAAARASEDKNHPMDSSLPPGMEKIGESPGALSAIRNLMEVLKKNGIDVASGQKPSMMELAKLATNSEVREATGKGLLSSTDVSSGH